MELKHCKRNRMVSYSASTRGGDIKGRGRIVAVHEGGRGPYIEVYDAERGRHVNIRPSQLTAV